MGTERRSTSFVAVSGFNFPTCSRKYMVDLMKEIVELRGAKFVLVAGHVLDGDALEKEKKLRLKELDLEFALAKKAKKPMLNDTGKEASKVELQIKCVRKFVAEQVGALDQFLPKIKDVNYHIVVAEKIYDKPIGLTILHELRKIRDDIRIFDDPEAKIPIELPGFKEMRVLVPRFTPWFYDNVTGLMQRLINQFANNAKSPMPQLLIAGCTGVGAYLPTYRGVAAIAVPGMNKGGAPKSTENMVGCTVVTITEAEEGFDIDWHVEDFRTVVFNEKALALPDNLSRYHQRVIDVLKPGGASFGTIEFRLNSDKKKRPMTREKIKECIEELQKRKLIQFDKAGNRYSIANDIVEKARITYAEFKKGSRTLTTVDNSCWHVGSLKTMYYTIMEDMVRLGENADAIIMNGDVTQGVSHNYEYNGEMLPTMNGPDKHQALAAKMQAKILMDIFKLRWEKTKREKMTTIDLVNRCLIEFQFKYGNHDEPRFNHGKDTRPLWLFEEILRKEAVYKVTSFLEEHKHNNVTFKQIADLVNSKIIRIGESRVAIVKNIAVGVKHPYMSRTASKGTRPKQAIDFYMQYVRDWPDERLKSVRLVKVANFHEAAAIFFGGFGSTYLSVMTGAQVYDTLFESNQNKVVDHGLAKTTVEFNEQGQILSGTVHYSKYIAPKDRKILFKEDLSALDVSKLASDLASEFDIPWR